MVLRQLHVTHSFIVQCVNLEKYLITVANDFSSINFSAFAARNLALSKTLCSLYNSYNRVVYFSTMSLFPILSCQ